VGWKKLLIAALGVVLSGACALAPIASARRPFRPRVAHAMGLVPAHGQQVDPALATAIPELYHGGPIMHGVTVHAIWWAPPGFRFDPSPSAGVPSYASLVEQYLSDLSVNPRGSANIFSILDQYPDAAGTYGSHIAFEPSRDSILDRTPYPPAGQQCVSPSGVRTCVTDFELQREIERVIQSRDPGGHGLHDLWFIFLPPDVDTCITVGSCATNDFAGYHSLLNFGRGPAVYVVVPDPLVEFTPSPGSDPQGNPEAETTLDTVGHEAAEAITNPDGDGWMDPNGFEVADKCEIGPQAGTPLGYAPDGSPYNQLLNGHEYLIQTIWSNADSGCQQSSAATKSALPLPTVSLRQFSPRVAGSMGFARGGVAVTVLLARGGDVVAGNLARTRADGTWKLTLRSLADGHRAGVGDDREELLVRYGTHGPSPELIQTGNGGDPFGQSGWTGWFDLDHGFAVHTRAVLLSPCSQVGVLTLTGAGATPSPVENCVLAYGAVHVSTHRLGPAAALHLTSEDNRAPSLAAPNGALVKLTVALGEPNSVDLIGNPNLPFNTTGLPSCTADLHAQRVRCAGLVPRARYSLTRRRGRARAFTRADGAGTAAFPALRGRPALRGGDLLTLRNRTRRVLSTLHVAHLRVDLAGASTIVVSGSCQAGEFYGSQITTPPTGPGIGNPGVAGDGTVCPLSGRAGGLGTGHIFQLDDLSAGTTRTEVPAITGTAPLQDATLYGPFVALAQAALPGPHGTTIPAHDRIAVSVAHAGSHRSVFHAANVNTSGGVAVAALPRGSYVATWVLRDAGGDTRTIHTSFVEA
jgi:hypothetical protein